MLTVEFPAGSLDTGRLRAHLSQLEWTRVKDGQEGFIAAHDHPDTSGNWSWQVGPHPEASVPSTTGWFSADFQPLCTVEDAVDVLFDTVEALDLSGVVVDHRQGPKRLGDLGRNGVLDWCASTLRRAVAARSESRHVRIVRLSDDRAHRWHSFMRRRQRLQEHLGGEVMPVTVASWAGGTRLAIDFPANGLLALPEVDFVVLRGVRGLFKKPWDYVSPDDASVLGVVRRERLVQLLEGEFQRLDGVDVLNRAASHDGFSRLLRVADRSARPLEEHFPGEWMESSLFP